MRYFLYAFLYVIFAVDAVYLFPWATVIRSADLGMASLAEMGIFIGVLLVGLAHAARRGLLRWIAVTIVDYSWTSERRRWPRDGSSCPCLASDRSTTMRPARSRSS